MEWNISNVYTNLSPTKYQYCRCPKSDSTNALRKYDTSADALSYNTPYNVSITQPGVCGQPKQTLFTELSYSKLKYFTNRWKYAHLSHMTYYAGKCDNPLMLIHNDVIVVFYEDPSLEGENITFTCPILEQYLLDLTHLHVWRMENGNQTLERWSVVYW